MALIAVVTLGSANATAQLPSFNGAEGFGGTFTGTAPAGGWFSNAEVYHVTTTQDFLVNGKGAPGTLRGAFVDFTQPNSPKQKISNRIVVFDVGGTFELTQGTLDMKEINNIYVAGQTAPSPVVVYGNTSQITKSNNTMTSNVILRYMTFRKGTGDGADSITFAGGNGPGDLVATNMIIDHVSASWSEDEVLSVANNNSNVTVQYTMMTDSLTNGHQYGSLIRPKVNSNVTYHHNLYGNDKSRNPRVGSYNDQQTNLDFRNNVIYNYSDRAGYTGGASEAETEYVELNYVGNYVIAGPATPVGQKSTTAFTMDVSSFYNLSTNSVKSNPKDPIAIQIYQSGNLVDSNHNAVRDGTDLGWGAFIASDGTTTVSYPDFNYGPNSALPAKLASPFSAPAVTSQSASAAYDQVIDYVGNYWWSRDAIDQRIIGNVENNTQPAGGVPATAPVPAELAMVTAAAYPAAPTTRPAGWDSDNDGMPDVWEVAHGLNPNNSTDFKSDFDNDGYINLQEYLDEIGAFPAPSAITFNGATNSRYAQITNWKTNDGGMTSGSNWQPSRFDEARIDSGTVVVDAAGQHAGLLKLGASAASNATLSVNSGWLKVEDEVVIGADPTATAALNLAGGVLDAHQLSKGAGGTFSFTGGTLHADVVDFDLVNNGGTLSPGHSIGATHVAGNLTLNSGSLAIELASANSADSLIVDGAVALGGSLDVSLLSGFAPTTGDHWQIITAGDLSGLFSSVTSGYSVQKQGDNLLLYFGPAPTLLSGDYNDDGKVDAADYTVWRDALASGGALQNETVTLGTVDAADYNEWKSNFGAHSGSGGGSLGSVPEPNTVVLLVTAMMCVAARRRDS